MRLSACAPQFGRHLEQMTQPRSFAGSGAFPDWHDAPVLAGGKGLAGFAGATAGVFTPIERLETLSAI